MTKTDLIFPAFSSRFVDLAVQLCFRCKFSFNEERRSSQVWEWRDFSRPCNHNCLLRIATNEIASFCINHVKWLVLCKGGAKAGQKGGFRVMLKYFEIKKGFSLLYKTNRFHVAMRLIQ